MNNPYEENEDILQASGYYLAEDEQMEQDVKFELMISSWQKRIERAARETTQGSFLMQALRRNGVL